MIQPTPTAAPTPGVRHPLASHYSALWGQLRGMLAGHALLGVTSCQRREGVSTVAANLALCAAQSGQEDVLLVEANPNSPKLAEMFHLQANPGLVDVLRGEADLLSCVQATTVDRLSLLTVGADAASASFGLPGMPEILNELRRKYSVVVFDMAPAGGPSPCYSLGRRLDGMVLVMEAEKMDGDAARTVRDRLRRAGAQLLGVVLNKRVQKSLA